MWYTFIRGYMRLEELLKKEVLTSSELGEMIYRINIEKKDSENIFDLYNQAIYMASKLGIEELYKVYKEIDSFFVSEDEKKLLQGNVTFYICQKENMNKENIQQMLYFINTERQNDVKKIELYNKAILEASKYGISFLYQIYKEIENYPISEDEKRLLQGNVTFYISQQENMNKENIQQMLYFINTERQNDVKKIELYNQVIYNASKLGIDVLNKVLSELDFHNLTDEEKQLLQKDIRFYIDQVREKTNSDAITLNHR